MRWTELKPQFTVLELKCSEWPAVTGFHQPIEEPHDLPSEAARRE